MIFNCRDFFDPSAERRKKTMAHIGTHPIIMTHLVEYPKLFEYMRAAGGCLRKAVAQQKRDPVFAAWCRAGEKRSVAMALYTWHAISEVAGVQIELVHVCDAAWGRHTCAGTCPQCRSPLRLEMRQAREMRLAIDAFRSGHASP